MTDFEKTRFLIEASKKMVELGFDVYVAQGGRVFQSPTYGWVMDKEHKNFGYFEIEELSGQTRFSTTHKPSIIGTGFAVEEDGHGISVSDITPEYVRKSFDVASWWASGKDAHEAAKHKYKSFDEYLSLYWNKECPPVPFTDELVGELNELIKQHEK